MQLAFVTETFPPEINGVALTVRSLVDGLRERGHRVEVIRPRQAGPIPRVRADELFVRSSSLPRYPGLRFGWPAGRQLTARWREVRPDAVYVATEGPLGYSALRTARRLGIPVLTGFHTRFDTYLRHYGLGLLEPIAAGWLKRFHNAAQATLVPTPALQSELDARGHRNVALLRRGVDTARFSPDRRCAKTRAGWGLRRSELAVLHVGRLASEKNLDLLVAAFRAIALQRPDARLVLVGDGPAQAWVRHAVPDAVFCGMRSGDELATCYASGDLFLFPSLSETYGNVVLESLAAGVPVVAYAQGSALEYVTPEVGATVAPGDAGAFIDAAVALAADDEGRENMRAPARASVLAAGPERVALDFEVLVLRILAADAHRSEATAPQLLGAVPGNQRLT